MLSRLLTIGITGIALMGYAPRWLANSQHAWIIWAIAAGLVLGAPMLLRQAWSSTRTRLRAVQSSHARSFRLPFGGARKSSRTP